MKYTHGCIELEKELNELDKLAIKFSSILNKKKINYIVVSGYVAILFGRSRASEDIDIILQKLDYEKFKELWNELCLIFDCLNSDNAKEAYNNYLLDNTAVRFTIRDMFIPNIEIKFSKTELDNWSIENKIKVSLNKNIFYIGPLEVEIPFKLFLGSQKDIEDAKHLYGLFKDKINRETLLEFNKKLKIEDVFHKYIE
ncbi:hypothetical protein JXB41_03625 [Candidatus Woesearchaeota archaeon]|nr:hypothetical protein [Candidatus Woesearchaeota archaeon]